MRTLVVGAGATGGYFGGRLAQAGRDVTFLVRPARAAALARGLRITGPGGEVTVSVRTVTADAIDGPYDVILVAVKGYALEQAIADLAPAVGPATVVVPLLNGVRHVDTLRAGFGPDRVWGGVCMIHATLDADGGIVQLTDLHRLAYGPFAGADDRAGAVTAALSGAGFVSDYSATIEQDMWEKWMFLAALGAATTLMRATIGGISAAPGGPAFAAGVADEAVATLTVAGHPPSEGAVRFLRAGITATAPTTSSLYRDMVQGRPVEAGEILGDFVARATGRGAAVPLLSAAYTNLAIYAAGRG